MRNTDERNERARKIADGDEDVVILTIQLYKTDGSLTSPQIVGYALRKRLAKAMVETAEEYAKHDIDVLVGYIDGRLAEDDDWNELFEYLLAHEMSDDVDAVALLRSQMDAPGRPCAVVWPPRGEEWEDVALNPDVLAAHGGAQPTGSNAAACPTCGGTGRVKHPIIAGYFGDCPDCGDDCILM